MTISSNRFTNTLLPVIFTVLAGFAACSSDDDAPEPPKPSGYDIYTAGYTTPASKAVATVWKNGQQLYTLTDGTNDACAMRLPGKLSSFIERITTFSKSRLRVSRMPMTCTPSSGSPS